ncbi:hypothetical protein ROZALSC1DRAFT_28077 [Rozella allomycis CSF55]|uniref:Uncharacterized protein n=1 Tax=Rozella allomycis (strain CSF55) TaxID=988480 RepID=A0A075AR69_ROZAC|nr:hypothetical protein O9G_001516 [Rozella allomycis CSF55]RKP20423.1 hypothetical protein ROZALSC1DRAFT_28077 [Rozella allomycis CSF55]|eukprot:EPZ31042.1 hypothetical protein O9G_001516 [Rozella allomycis CSF55]
MVEDAKRKKPMGLKKKKDQESENKKLKPEPVEEEENEIETVEALLETALAYYDEQDIENALNYVRAVIHECNRLDTEMLDKTYGQALFCLVTFDVPSVYEYYANTEPSIKEEHVGFLDLAVEKLISVKEIDDDSTFYLGAAILRKMVLMNQIDLSKIKEIWSKLSDKSRASSFLIKTCENDLDLPNDSYMSCLNLAIEYLEESSEKDRFGLANAHLMIGTYLQDYAEAGENEDKETKLIIDNFEKAFDCFKYVCDEDLDEDDLLLLAEICANLGCMQPNESDRKNFYSKASHYSKLAGQELELDDEDFVNSFERRINKVDVIKTGKKSSCGKSSIIVI